MKDQLKPETRQAMRSDRMEKILERLNDSKDFWDLIAGHAAGELEDCDTDFPGEKTMSNADFLADLGIEICAANQSIDEEEEEQRGWEHA